jgi:hypothetical protein
LQNPNDPIPVFFTPSATIYCENWESPWKAIDNDLNEISYPLAKILTENSKLVFPSTNSVLISDNFKQAIILATNRITEQQSLFLASWYHDPVLSPIPLASSAFQGRHPVAEKSTLSPSGKWAYFKADGDNPSIPTGNFLIYLDPALPSGYLPPFYLGFDGEIEAATWMTNPEGLVVFIDGRLFYWDLSQFKAEDFGKAK